MNESADLREVWKRLAAEGYLTSTSGLERSAMWCGTRWVKPLRKTGEFVVLGGLLWPLIRTGEPSAMQGCKL